MTEQQWVVAQGRIGVAVIRSCNRMQLVSMAWVYLCLLPVRVMVLPATEHGFWTVFAGDCAIVAAAATLGIINRRRWRDILLEEWQKWTQSQLDRMVQDAPRPP